jgi:hypothetical protein
MNNNIVLTTEQKNIYDELINFIKSDTQRELLLIGYAGTGKTTLVAKFINDLINTKLCNNIVMVAPTHKAVNIAKSKLFAGKKNQEIDELSKIINIMTIHKLLNYRRYMNSNGERFFGKSKFTPLWSIYNLVVVDECSMLSNQIILDIKSQLSNPANPNVKIIYVGDPAQLPPVKQHVSKIFSDSIKSLVLDKIIRTSNEQIMLMSNSHRTWIFSKNINDIPHIGDFESECIKIYSILDKETEKWLNEFISLLKNNDKQTIEEHNNNIILTWTNKKSNQYNQYIREKLFNKKDLAYYEIGEILIFNDFYTKIFTFEEIDILDNNNKIKKIENISFYTSEQIKVIELKEINYKFEKLKFMVNDNLSLDINDKFKKYYDKINKLIDVEINVFELKIQKISDLFDDKSLKPIYDILSISNNSKTKKIYDNIYEEMEKIIIKLKSSCYKIIQKMNDSDNMKNCDLYSEIEKNINKLYGEYQTNIIDCFAQLNYGYCITVHKSQGSTFLNVFIDINDILDNNDQSETSKCLYTAITRSSKTLNLLV